MTSFHYNAIKMLGAQDTPATGAALTVERQVPNIVDAVVDLG